MTNAGKLVRGLPEREALTLYRHAFQAFLRRHTGTHRPLICLRGDAGWGEGTIPPYYPVRWRLCVPIGNGLFARGALPGANGRYLCLGRPGWAAPVRAWWTWRR